MQLQLPQITEVRGMRVLTTRQIAEAYGTDIGTIQYNFRYNKKRYVLGKHYIEVVGDELRTLKTRSEFHSSLKYAKSAYLWTEKGALLHAKSLNTDKAWEVYDYLVDFYFRAKEQSIVKETKPEPVKQSAGKAATMTVVNAPENPEILNAIQTIKDDLTCMNVLLEDCKRYLSEETYKERRKAAADVVHILIGDLTRFLHLQPKLVEKYY